MTDQNDITQIVIPEGQMAAPGDYKLKETSVQIGDEKIIIPTIEQHNSSNCVEYSLLQTVILAKSLGLKVSEEIETFLKEKPINLAVDQFEMGYVLHILRYYQDIADVDSLSEATKQNYNEKLINIYHPLNGYNALLLFRSMFKGLDGERPLEIDSTKEDLNLLSQNGKSLVILEADIERGHATTTLVIGKHVFHINTLRENQVISIETREQLLLRYQEFLNENNYLSVYEIENEE